MLKRELDAVSYEITETYINDIAKEISSLKRSIGMDGIILTGTLLKVMQLVDYHYLGRLRQLFPQ